MNTIVLGIEPFLDRIDAGYPLLYPLIQNEMLKLVSLNGDNIDPLVSLAELNYQHSRPWQAVILIPEDHLSLTTWDHILTQLKELTAHLTDIISKNGKPDRYWVVWIQPGAGRTIADKASIRPDSEEYDRYFFLGINPAELTGYQQALPLLLIFLSQWHKPGRNKFWRLHHFALDDMFQTSLHRYRGRLINAQRQMQHLNEAPLSARVELIDESKLTSSHHLPPHKELTNPEVRSSAAWNEWQDNTHQQITSYLDQGKKHLQDVGLVLRKQKQGRTSIPVEDLNQEISAQKQKHKSHWEQFRGRQHSILSENWQDRIKPVADTIRDLFACRPTMPVRTVTVCCSFLLLLLPMIIALHIHAWDIQLLSGIDARYLSGFSVFSCIIIVLLLEFFFYRKRRRLCLQAGEIANKDILQQTNTDTRNNTDYLASAFAFSAATMNLESLEQAKSVLENRRKQLHWFETELAKHLSRAEKLAPNSTPLGATSSHESVEIFHESSVPCSQSQLFSLTNNHQGGTILFTAGTAKDQIEGALFPGKLSITLIADGH